MSSSHSDSQKLDRAFQKALGISTQSKKSSSFDAGMEECLPLLLTASFESQASHYEGVVFNQYEIIKRIGTGGMGDVYLAQRNDGQYEKKVAIKILSHNHHLESTKQRFLREKQILAELRHPHIVPLIDAGTTDDGAPWFVLEYINGKPIDNVCEEQHFSIEQSTRLMLKVCDAIHFAHNKGIIHRDIKPDNILVEEIDGSLTPVVLDFGIAQKKDQLELTQQGHVIGTPNYMSPEQISGDLKKLDRRSDIFSLGVVLYRLLTGEYPFKGNSTVAVYEKILNSTESRATQLNPSFPKDLSTILSTCLKKDPAERYQSVAELKQDLQRWLSGEPIVACQESLAAASWRWIRQHRVATAMSLLILAVSLTGFIKYTYDINKERQLALASKTEADDLLTFLVKDLYQQLSEIGRVDLLQSVAEKSLAHLDDFSGTLSAEQVLKQVISYRNIAEVLDMQDNIKQSEAALNTAKSLLLNLQQTDRSPLITEQVAYCLVDLANLHAKMGKLELASSEYESALFQLNSLRDFPEFNGAMVKWTVDNAYAWNLMEQTNYDKALRHLESGLSITNQQLDLVTDSKFWQQTKLKSLTTFGWFYSSTRDLKNSQKYYLEARQLAEQLHLTYPQSIPITHGLQKVYNQLAYTYLLDNDFIATIDAAEHAVELGKKLQIQAPNNQAYFRATAYAHTTLGDAFLETGDPGNAQQSYQQGLSITQQLSAATPDSSSLANDFAIDSLNLGNLLSSQGDTEPAKMYWQQAEHAIADIAKQPDASIYYVDTYAQVLLSQGKTEQALPYLQMLKSSAGWGSTVYYELIDKYQLTDNTLSNPKP